MNEQTVTIYTDGACSGNPGPGGWGAVLMYKNQQKNLQGYEPDTTNNRMELSAVIFALQALKYRCNVSIYTDSIYVKQGCMEWMANWKKNNWRNSQKQAVKNQDLWQILDELLQKHSIAWFWVKGHSGDTYNEMADSLAREAILKHKI